MVCAHLGIRGPQVRLFFQLPSHPDSGHTRLQQLSYPPARCNCETPSIQTYNVISLIVNDSHSSFSDASSLCEELQSMSHVLQRVCVIGLIVTDAYSSASDAPSLYEDFVVDGESWQTWVTAGSVCFLPTRHSHCARRQRFERPCVQVLCKA